MADFDMSDLKASLIGLHEMYKTAQEAGFSKPEALQLVIAIVQAGMAQGQQGSAD